MFLLARISHQVRREAWLGGVAFSLGGMLRRGIQLSLLLRK